MPFFSRKKSEASSKKSEASKSPDQKELKKTPARTPLMPEAVFHQWSELPLDIQLSVLTFSDIPDIGYFAQANSATWSLAKNERLWKELLKRDFGFDQVKEKTETLRETYQSLYGVHFSESNRHQKLLELSNHNKTVKHISRESHSTWVGVSVEQPITQQFPLIEFKIDHVNPSGSNTWGIVCGIAESKVQWEKRQNQWVGSSGHHDGLSAGFVVKEGGWCYNSGGCVGFPNKVPSCSGDIIGLYYDIPTTSLGVFKNSELLFVHQFREEFREKVHFSCSLSLQDCQVSIMPYKSKNKEVFWEKMRACPTEKYVK